MWLLQRLHQAFELEKLISPILCPLQTHYMDRRVLSRWLSALAGFYKPTEGEEPDAITKLLYSARSVILVISAQAAIISGLLAALYGNFNTLYFLLVLVGYILLHLVSNLSNDYFGFVRGHDSPDSPRLRYTPHPLASGYFTRTQIKSIVLMILSIPLAITIYFLFARGVLVTLFAIPGFLLLYLYDAAKTSLKSIGLGEVASFIVWGPIMIAGGYYVITGNISYLPFVISIPYGLGVMLILLGKHIDQMDFDRSKGQRTLPVILGEGRALKLATALILAMYVVPTLIILSSWDAKLIPLLFIYLNIPKARRAISGFIDSKPQTPPLGYVGWPLWYHRFALTHNRTYGWLYILGLATSTFIALLR